MQVRVVHGNITDVEADVLIVNLFSGVQVPGGATGAMDKAVGGMLGKLIKSRNFSGSLGECLSFVTTDLPGIHADSVSQVIVVGLGPREKFDLDAVRTASAAALDAARSHNPDVRVASIIHGAGIGGLNSEQAAQAVVEGSLLAAYEFRHYKSEDSPNAAHRRKTPRELLIVEFDETKLPLVERGVRRGVIFAQSTNLARDLVNTPPNDMTPTRLAQTARDVADQLGLHCEIKDAEQMKDLGMGALLGVAQGSAAPPKLIILKYQAETGAPTPTLGFVGKGVTFDSGGLSLKTAEGMIAMKDDMAGAAAVLGAMSIIAAEKPAIDVLAVIPCVENMPSGSAQRPGDVVRAMNGKTIEIVNTDAEGRLILADAVAYARSQKVDAIVDVSTLTGAVGIALGDRYTGVISNNDGFVSQLMEAARRTGERFWQLPGDEDFKEDYASDIADIKNVGGRLAGAITGGLIIGEFAEDTPWIHMDIGGTSSRETARGYLPKGATGVATRTLAQLALTWDLSTLTQSEPTDR